MFLVYSVNQFISTPSVDTVVFYMEGVNNCWWRAQRKTSSAAQDTLTCAGGGDQPAVEFWRVDWNSVSPSADTWLDRL